MRMKHLLVVFMIAGLFIAGCSHDDPMEPGSSMTINDKDGTEYLGEITVADGSGFAEGGVGMTGVDEGILDIMVPAGASVEQVLLYWVGGTTTAAGDDEIVIDGTPVTGDLIGGPTVFYGNYSFYAFRADITGLGLVTAGANSFTISEMDFDFTGGPNDENDGVGMVVVYDDGSAGELQYFDGLDLAYFEFSPTLDATAPVTFDFAASGEARVAQMVVQSGSVGENRPNRIVATTSAGEQIFENPMGSTDGNDFDSIVLDVNIPAGDTQLTVQLFSVPSSSPQGASLTWTGTGLTIAGTPPPLYCIGDYVWYDENRNGCQDAEEMGAEGVEVQLYEGCMDGQMIATTVTDMYGAYMFCELEPGDYMVRFIKPGDYEFCMPMVAACGPEYDSNPNKEGWTNCITIVDQDDMTIDAGLCMPPEEGCTYTIGKWKNWTGLGPQPDIMSPLLPVWLGDEGGSESYQVTDVYMAVDFLSQKVYGKPSNGITKLYAQMLAAKLNVANGASDGAIAGYLADADAFLADYNYMDWKDLDDAMKDDVMMWHGAFDDYNNGDIGPGHCDDDDDDEEDMRLNLK